MAKSHFHIPYNHHLEYIALKHPSTIHSKSLHHYFTVSLASRTMQPTLKYGTFAHRDTVSDSSSDDTTFHPGGRLYDELLAEERAHQNSVLQEVEQQQARQRQKSWRRLWKVLWTFVILALLWTVALVGIIYVHPVVIWGRKDRRLKGGMLLVVNDGGILSMNCGDEFTTWTHSGIKLRENAVDIST
ncbi:hypothetical protein B0O99DRAFT_607507 [Bisporella sp. PMI_857]|nr:hypothetical protein B0O99DRAFT_607507 [Bisporella sp. PMI_857]